MRRVTVGSIFGRSSRLAAADNPRGLRRCRPPLRVPSFLSTLHDAALARFSKLRSMRSSASTATGLPASSAARHSSPNSSGIILMLIAHFSGNGFPGRSWTAPGHALRSFWAGSGAQLWG